MNLIIKPAKLQDAKQLFNLLQLNLLEVDNFIMDPDEFDYTIEDEQTKIKSLSQDNNAYLAAWLDNQIVGCISLTGGNYRKNRHVGNLEIYVRPEHRRQKTAQQLLQALLKILKQAKIIKKIEVEVWTNNQPAIKFYQKSGFKAESRKYRSFKLDKRYIDSILLYQWLK